MPTPEVTLARFLEGMTFEEYVAYVATPQNLAREAGGPLGLATRSDQSGALREGYEAFHLTPDQQAAAQWLTAQPGGPAHCLVISEEWSSDCRRDLPALARLAEATGITLRVFTRDGQHYSDTPEPTDSPNGDLMRQFLRHRDGTTYQSIPVVAFFDADMKYLCYYQEFPAIYDKDRLRANPDAPFFGDDAAWGELLRGPFFRIWQSAAIDDMLSQLHRVTVLGKS